MGEETPEITIKAPEKKEREAKGRGVVVHFVRHGEAASYRPGGGLTEEGREQAFEAGKSLLSKIGKDEMVKFVYSPLERARESNEVMTEGLKEAIEEEKRNDVKLYSPRPEAKLRPQDLIDETRFIQLKREGKDVIGYWLSGFITAEEAETPELVLERVKEFIKRREKISQRLPEGPAIHYVCITHSPFMRTLLRDAFGEDFGEPKMGESIELLFASDQEPQVKFRDRATEYKPRE